MIGPGGPIKLVNSAWWRFAKQNSLEDLSSISPGVNYLDVCRRAVKDGDESARAALEGIESVLRGGVDEFMLEYPCHSPDKKRWYQMKATPVGEGGCVVIAHLDITERRMAEEALRESFERYRVLYEDNPAMYFTVDSRGTVLSVNRFGAEQLGYSVEELEGQPILPLFHPEDRESVSKQLELCLNNPKELALREFRKVRKDGGILWVKLAASAVSWGDEKEEILIVCGDITDRKLFEQELKENAEKLERSNKDLQEFAFIASHDLQEPLRKVRSFGSRLIEKHRAYLNEEGRDYLDRMLNATKRMSQMVESLLTYSRVATRAEEFQKIDLTRLVQEVAGDLEVSIEKSGGRVEVGELPEIEADQIQMQQLFMNLIGNSLKFHRQGEPPVIRVSTEHAASCQAAGEGRMTTRCRIFIEDNGIGFDEKHLDRIFSLFQRLHGRSEFEGAGMGLAICRKIVERHGGSITAKSKPGEGSTFIITLPLKQPKPEA